MTYAEEMICGAAYLVRQQEFEVWQRRGLHFGWIPSTVSADGASEKRARRYRELFSTSQLIVQKVFALRPRQLEQQLLPISDRSAPIPL